MIKPAQLFFNWLTYLEDGMCSVLLADLFSLWFQLSSQLLQLTGHPPSLIHTQEMERKNDCVYVFVCNMYMYMYMHV